MIAKQAPVRFTPEHTRVIKLNATTTTTKNEEGDARCNNVWDKLRIRLHLLSRQAILTMTYNILETLSAAVGSKVSAASILWLYINLHTRLRAHRGVLISSTSTATGSSKKGQSSKTYKYKVG